MRNSLFSLWNQIFSNFFSKTVAFTNFCQKSVRVYFHNFHTVNKKDCLRSRYCVSDKIIRLETKMMNLRHHLTINYITTWVLIIYFWLKRKRVLRKPYSQENWTHSVENLEIFCHLNFLWINFVNFNSVMFHEENCFS